MARNDGRPALLTLSAIPDGGEGRGEVVPRIFHFPQYSQSGIRSPEAQAQPPETTSDAMMAIKLHVTVKTEPAVAVACSDLLADCASLFR